MSENSHRRSLLVEKLPQFINPKTSQRSNSVEKIITPKTPSSFMNPSNLFGAVPSQYLKGRKTILPVGSRQEVIEKLQEKYRCRLEDRHKSKINSMNFGY